MKMLAEYQKPKLREYSYFGIVVDGETKGPGGQGGERTDDTTCTVSGLDVE